MAFLWVRVGRMPRRCAATSVDERIKQTTDPLLRRVEELCALLGLRWYPLEPVRRPVGGLIKSLLTPCVIGTTMSIEKKETNGISISCFLYGSLWCIVWFACQVNTGPQACLLHTLGPCKPHGQWSVHIPAFWYLFHMLDSWVIWRRGVAVCNQNGYVIRRSLYIWTYRPFFR